MPKIRCECSGLLAYRDDQAGRTVICPLCFSKIHLPMTPPPKTKKPSLHGNMDALLEQRLSAIVSAPPSKSQPMAKLGKPRSEAERILLGKPVVVQPPTEESGILVSTTPPTGAISPPPRAPRADVAPKNELKLDAASDDIPLAGEAPTWQSPAPPAS